MQTNLAEFIRGTAAGREAEQILRKCVHCGFCNATCPTYQILGDELDGPRGRIYLIKQLLEGQCVSNKTQTHLDRCLTCRACETTCPSGVSYGRLLDIGREIVEQKVPRRGLDRVLRFLLRVILPYPSRVRPLLKLTLGLRPVLPASIRRSVPTAPGPGTWPAGKHTRQMLALDACVQNVVAPQIDSTAAYILDKLGVSLIRASGGGCCGALSHHMGDHSDALDFMRRNIDAWWPHIVAGAEALVMTASGCGVVVKEYGELLKDDPAYAGKAARISSMTKDMAEVLAVEDLSALNIARSEIIAFQAPCTLQHGQRIHGVVEGILQCLGFKLTTVPDNHLCCGSAGTYSILQQELSQTLLYHKVRALESGQPSLIVTANIGCLLHLQSGTDLPVKHWLELLAD